MEFLEEDAKPRFMFQSRAQQISDLQQKNKSQQPFNKPHFFFSISISALIFTLTFLFINSEPLNTLLFWVAFSFLLGPFAPTSLTAGDIRVGQGSVVQFPTPPIQDQDKPPQFKKKTTSKSQQRSEIESGGGGGSVVAKRNGVFETTAGNAAKMIVEEEEVEEDDEEEEEEEEEGERDWSEEDFEVLKKQMAKHPVGVPRRWEVITAAFNGGHKMESVVKMAKSKSMMVSDKKLSDNRDDSYARFMKDRKPIDKRAEESMKNDEMSLIGNGNGENRKENDGLVWSAEEDIALLNALKAFTKDVSMRWEKIAAAVPGKTKSACMKRVTELKKGFRNSKASSEA